MVTQDFRKVLTIPLFYLCMLFFMSCSSKTSESDATKLEDHCEEYTYDDIEPLINGDSLFSCYPGARDDRAQRIRMEKVMYDQITKKKGNRLPCIELIPFMYEEGHSRIEDSVFVQFVSYNYSVRVSAVIPKEEAQKLSLDSFYRIRGTFIGFPASKAQWPKVTTDTRKIDIGVLEYENLTFTDFPESELDYFLSSY